MTEPSTRREALVRTAAFLAASSLGSGFTLSSALGEIQAANPSHDPSYSVIPTRAHLIRTLSVAAHKAQEHPRIMDRITITGLPVSVLDIDHQILRIMKASGIPGVSLGIAKGKNVVLARGYGKATLVGHVPVEPTTIGGLMSVSKTLTVTAALTLIRDGKLHFDDRACEVLPEGPLLGPGQSADPRRSEITVRHLMSHTSGLFNVVETLNDPGRFLELARQGQIRLVHGLIAQADLVRIGWKEPLLFDPGKKFAYSGQGMQVLARIVERRSGQRLDRYIQKRIFDPLGIRSYYVGSYLGEWPFDKLMKSDRQTLHNLCPCLYDQRSKRHIARNLTYLPYHSWGEADACGWACTNVVDLLRYACFLPDVIGPELMREVFIRPEVMDEKGQRAPSPMGLGWGIYHRNENGLKYVRIQHSGGWPGERSFVELRTNGDAFALQINSDNQAAVDELIHEASQFVDSLLSKTSSIIDWSEYGYPAFPAVDR